LIGYIANSMAAAAAARSGGGIRSGGTSDMDRQWRLAQCNNIQNINDRQACINNNR
jgi:hypothetical protein